MSTAHRAPTTAGQHGQRCRAAARSVLPAQAAIAGRSAAWLDGAKLARDDDPIEIVTPYGARFGPVNGLLIHVADLPDSDLVVVDGIPRTTTMRTCFDLACWLRLPDTVAYLDTMLVNGAVDQETLHRCVAQRTGQRGWRKLQRAVSLLDPAARSPAESRLRVRLVLAGLPAPVSQHAVTHDGQHLGCADLAWPEHRLGLTCHLPDGAGVERMRAAGWIMLDAGPRRLREDFTGLVTEARHALRSRHLRR